MVAWNKSLSDHVKSKGLKVSRKKGYSLNPKLQVRFGICSQEYDFTWQIFYDEEMVFDIFSAHSSTWGQWNEYKLVSHYREDINITVTVVGATGSLTADGHVGLVLLDDIVITVRKNSK